MPAVRELAFALERFEWTGEQLEVVGRWSGLRGRRLSRPVLTVSTAGARQRLSALPGGQLGVRGDEPWRAIFAWDGSEEIESAELEVGRSLLVELRAPTFRPPPPPPTDADLRAEIEALRAELVRVRGAAAEADGLREELQLLRVAHGSLREAHERLEDELESLREPAAERERLAAALAEQRDAAAAAEARLADELAAAQERERDLRAEVDAARAEADELRHGQPGPTTNGASGTEDTVPAAATVAGRSRTPRAPAARHSPAAQRRAQAARAAAAGRVPTVPASTAAIWAVRAVAAVLVAGLIAAVVVVLTQVHL
jgi:hypothetical protein